MALGSVLLALGSVLLCPLFCVAVPSALCCWPFGAVLLALGAVLLALWLRTDDTLLCAYDYAP